MIATQHTATNQSPFDRLPWIVIFALHQILGTAGAIVLSGFICDAGLGLLHRSIPSTVGIRASWLLTEIPGFPVQVVLGFAVGFLIARGTLSRTAVWVWILPFLFLCFGGIVVVHPVGPRFDYLFGDACKPAEHCFYQLLFALPFLVSIGYAAGAWLARVGVTRERTRNIRPTTS